jgi:NADH-quinone oxidoreductase subunit J
VAVLEAIVYAGAIMVLFLFVIMMLNMGQHTIDQEKTWMAAKGWALPAGLAAILLAQLLYVLREYRVDIVPNEVGVLEVSALLFGPYVLAVELASILLLAGLVSAYHLAKK